MAVGSRFGWVNIQGTSTDPLAGEFPPAAVYASRDGINWRRVASISNVEQFASVGSGDGRWIAVGTSIHQGDVSSFTYVSTDGTTWKRQSDASLESSVSAGLIAFGAGRWALGGTDISPQHQSSPESGVVALSPDVANWTFPPGGRFAGSRIFGIAYGNGEWLASESAETCCPARAVQRGPNAAPSTQGPSSLSAGRRHRAQTQQRRRP